MRALEGIVAGSLGAFTWVMTMPEELEALDQLADRLRSRFPEAPPDVITRLVERFHSQYDGRPIRDFIAVLVEREVVEHFRLPQQRRG